MSQTPRPPTVVTLVWDDELRFTAETDGSQLMLDSRSKAGPSPMQALAAALAGCMAMDVVSILVKGRHPLEGLRGVLTGMRADDPPSRFTEMSLVLHVEGDVPSEAIERAIQLSKDKYCSVWHSLRQDISLTTSYKRE